RMEKLLLEQQINHKIPGYLPEGTPVAHKTGEDDGITNDVAVVYSENPCVICFASNFTDVPAAERAIREISLALI
ncbi:MAG: serine hydrolase, partial [Oscillospiraceae bacterium]|nr:serine hydrolase [Oscillospiraceae bacterium]